MGPGPHSGLTTPHLGGPSLPAAPAAPARWPWSGKGTWDARPGLHQHQEHCGQPADCLHWLSLPAGLPWGTRTPTSASDGLKQGTLRRTHLAGFVSAEERKKGLLPSSKHFWEKGMSQCTGPADGGRSGQTPTGAPRQVWETGHHPQGCYQWCQVPQSLQTTPTPSFTSLNDRTVMVCPSPPPPALGGGNIRTQDFSNTETQQGHPTCVEPHSQPQHHMGLRHCPCEVKDRVKKAWVLTE